MCNILKFLQCSHHANTFDFNHDILVAGDKIGISSMKIVHHNQLFYCNYDSRINEFHEEGSKWASEENSEPPLKEKEYRVKRLK